MSSSLVPPTANGAGINESGSVVEFKSSASKGPFSRGNSTVVRVATEHVSGKTEELFSYEHIMSFNSKGKYFEFLYMHEGKSRVVKIKVKNGITVQQTVEAAIQRMVDRRRRLSGERSSDHEKHRFVDDEELPVPTKTASGSGGAPSGKSPLATTSNAHLKVPGISTTASEEIVLPAGDAPSVREKSSSEDNLQDPANASPKAVAAAVGGFDSSVTPRSARSNSNAPPPVMESDPGDDPRRERRMSRTPPMILAVDSGTWKRMKEREKESGAGAGGTAAASSTTTTTTTASNGAVNMRKSAAYNSSNRSSADKESSSPASPRLPPLSDFNVPTILLPALDYPPVPPPPL